MLYAPASKAIRKAGNTLFIKLPFLDVVDFKSFKRLIEIKRSSMTVYSRKAKGDTGGKDKQYLPISVDN